MGNFRIFTIISLLLSIFACSSSDDSTPVSGTPTPTPTPTGVTSGLFVDVEVSGMSYATATLAGDTDQYGTYFYAPGEDITFSIDGATLGTIPGAPAITPNDFGTDDTIANVARFIQSLDADDDPTNGIDVTQAAAALAAAGTTISADVFQASPAAFEANPQIQDAMAAANKVLIDRATALANLAAGTDSTFDFNELFDNLFVIVDPTSNAVGVISFESTLAFSILSTDTTSAGDDGDGAEDSWTVDGNGVLQLQDTTSASTTTINRIGSSTEMIAVTVSEDGSAPLPAAFVIPETVTTADLGGDGINDFSKTYSFEDLDGSTVSVTFNSDGTYSDSSGDTGVFQVGFPLPPDVVGIVSNSNQTVATLMIVLEGSAVNVGDKVDLWLARVTVIDPATTDFRFDQIGLGSVTLTSTN